MCASWSPIEGKAVIVSNLQIML